MPLPEGWVETALGEIASYIQRGKSPKYTEKSKLAVINQKAIRWDGIRYKDLKYVHPEQWSSWPEERYAKQDDILWNSTGTGTIGRACLIEELDPSLDYVVDSHVTILRFPQSVEPKYAFYWIMSPSVQEKIDSMYTGSTNQVELSKKAIQETIIPLAPLNEQRRIVAKLEDILAKVQSSQARLDKIPDILKRTRQAILSAAVSGKLTEDWSEENTQPEWEALKLSDVIFDKPKNGYSPKPVDYPTSVKSLTLTATTSGKFDPNYFKYIDEQIPGESPFWLNDGDILIQRGNTIEYVGVSAIYRGNSKEFIYPDLMMKIRVNSKALNKFVHYCLLEKETRKYFRTNATGTAGNMPKINQAVVMNTPINVPSLDEQQEIVQRVEALFERLERIESAYEAAREKVDAITQSALAKAFRGELVPQDPNDEPASELLERIKAEKSNEASSQKSKKVSTQKKKELVEASA